MAKKITYDKLFEMMSDPQTKPEDLAPYFQEASERSAAFSPAFEINLETVAKPRANVGRRSAMLLNLANSFARTRRMGQYHQNRERNLGRPVIVAEGDSWFQYPLLLEDTIDCLMTTHGLPIYPLSGAGDLLQDMVRAGDYIRALRSEGASILLFSGGGNDLLGEGRLAKVLDPWQSGLKAADLINRNYQSILDEALGHYERIFTSVQAALPHVTVICHGYDYSIPQVGGRWLGEPMDGKAISDKPMQKEIIRLLIDQFNRELRRLCDRVGNAVYIDCRDVVDARGWHDELHPKNPGYAAVAKKFAKAIEDVPRERGASIVHAGPFGAVPRSRQGLNAPELGGTGDGASGQSISLHIGINLLDPSKYEGWDGKLVACEADAIAMEQLAQRLGFSTTRLLSSEATRDAVVASIKGAAQKLEPGGMFLMTVSSHGGKIPDLNMDEDVASGDDIFDEALLLHDYMIADDELYGLWCEFGEKTRVLMVADTCHSGSMVRNAMDMMSPTPWGPVAAAPVGPAKRFAPRSITMAVAEKDPHYRKVAEQYSKIKESVIKNPLTTPIKAAVMNFGACEDHQFAMDGNDHGAFTSALLDVWNKGRFSGTYDDMLRAVTQRIASASQTPRIKMVGATDPAFRMQKPFVHRVDPGVLAETGIPVPPPRPATAADVPPAILMETAKSEDFGAQEGPEEELSKAELDALFDTDPAASRSSIRAAWSLYGDFTEFIGSLSLPDFSPDEFLVLGGSHSGSGPCGGKNSYPPKALWPNLSATARVLQALRTDLGRSIRITNAYRAPAYNACIGGASGSQHKVFKACDFAVQGMAPSTVAIRLREMRDNESLFVGGVGTYNTFVHVDTRGYNATWTG